jgi:hypothetical protein
MAKAKVGSGELEPFKKGSCHSESIGGSTDKEHVRKGFTPNVHITRVSREESKLTPFETGPTGPGRNTSEGNVPAFREKKDCGIPNPNGYKAFKK